MAMDIISQIIQSSGYLFSLVVLALLWRKASRPSDARYFWTLLAAAWTLNLLGNIAWILHDVLTGNPLDTFSFVDLFYVLRYGVIGCALWLYPTSLARRDGLWVAGIMLAAILVAGGGYFDPAIAFRGEEGSGFLGLAMYMILDVGIVTLAWLRVRAVQQSAWSRQALLLFSVMVSYGIANTINLAEYVLLRTSGGVPQNLFWILSDVLLLVLVISADLPKQNKSLMRNEV